MTPEKKETNATVEEEQQEPMAVLPAEAPEGDGEIAPAAVGAKKPLGTKEVVPFAWKLIGHTRGTAVTLFKAVDRQDVEVQYERILKDGYYKDLVILDINAKVAQPKQAKNAKPAGAGKPPAKPAVVKNEKPAPKPAPKNAVINAAAKKTPTRPPSKKTKAAAKKTPPSRTTAKRTTKKK